MIQLKRAALAALAAAFSLTGAALALPQPPPAVAAEWPQAHSDLRADPTIRFGALPNGMRYAIMKNATPPGQVSMRLRFAVGSIMERDDQQGLAHFLEHMAFNGSTNVPTRGEMVKDLERLGLAFGADTNAATGFDSTTYKFDLPKADDQTVDTSLMLLREIAGNLTLSQAAMDEERGVILSEERLRDTPGYRVTKARYGFLMQGQRPPERFPIGLVPVIEKAKADLIADIYHHYYRPERAVLVIVGDVDPDAIEAKIKARFGDWRGQGPAGADPDLGKVAQRGPDVRLAVEAGSPTTLELAWVAPPDLSPDDVAKQRRQTIERLALAVLNRRLGTLTRDASPPFISAGAFRGNQLRAERVTGVIVLSQPDHWKEGLATAETEVRRAVQFGVRPDELAREITETEAALKLAAAGATTRRTPAMADEIVGTLEDGDVETSPADDLALFEATTKGLTADEVSATLKALFAGQGPLVFMSAPAQIDGGQAAIRTAFDAAARQSVTAPEAPRQVDWPYTSFGPAGKVADRKDVTDLDTVFVRFANGVRLTIKPTKFRQDQVLVKVRFGQGLRDLPPDHQTITWAGGAFIEGGLKQMSADDRERALAGAVYGANFNAEADAFALSGVTRPADLATQLEVLAAYASEPGWRPEALQRLKTYGLTLEDQFEATDTGLLSRDLSGLLHAGDKRWTFPTRAEIGAATPEELKAAIGPAIAGAPVEVVIVGDTTVDKAIDAVAETFGALSTRPDPAPPTPPAHGASFPSPVAQPVVETHTGRADQGIAFVAWPTDDFFSNPQGARTQAILGRVLQLRLTDTLRMKEGVTYSPNAGSVASEVFPHYGYIDAMMEAPPAKLDGFFDDVTQIAADLRTTPVGDDELQRAKKPAIEQLEKSMATNEYWLEGLSGAQADPRLLDALRSAEAGLERVSPADLQKAAQTYLKDSTAWRLEIKPKTAVATAAPAAKS
ncbi:MAG TPA: insulinase family protein [Caulobacteraceae bacterium]|nr:insulinase family protein [Caulobacteraceae bacterium]